MKALPFTLAVRFLHTFFSILCKGVSRNTQHSHFISKKERKTKTPSEDVELFWLPTSRHTPTECQWARITVKKANAPPCWEIIKQVHQDGECRNVHWKLKAFKMKLPHTVLCKAAGSLHRKYSCNCIIIVVSINSQKNKSRCNIHMPKDHIVQNYILNWTSQVQIQVYA